MEKYIDEIELKERLQTIRNKVDISLILIHCNREELLPTILEDLFEDCQIIIDLYCIQEETNPINLENPISDASYDKRAQYKPQ